jgi:hypothetical protein
MAEIDDSALQSLLKTSYDDAASYADDVLAPEREKAFDYYLGDVYSREGAPEKAEDLQGRTSIVSREVADVVHQMLPGLIRIFTSGEEVVRYEPQNEEDVPVAEQQTDYVNFLLDADGNNWFVTLHDAVHDALLKKNGTIKWWWDERAQIEEFTYTGLSPVQAETLRSDPEIDVLEETATATEAADGPPPSSPAAPAPPAPGAMPPQAAAPGGPPGMAPPAMPPQALPVPPEVTIDMRVRRTRIRKCLRICAVPPEEFLIAREARDVPTSPYCAHRTTKTVSELVEEGHDREEVESRASPDLTLVSASGGSESSEAVQRNPGLSVGSAGSGGQDKSLWYVLKVEHFIRYDSDNDGIAELHRIVTLGEGFDYICEDEIVPEAGFAVGSPVRMPHAVIGMSVCDQVLDLQDLKTNVLRGTLDSLAQAIFPAMAVVENAVNMADVLSTEVGRVIRMNAPGMAQPLAEPFIGPQALGVMAYLDQVKASRTGITNASTGLDDKVLQSTTRTAVENTVERAQERVEMIARTLAETMVRDTFRGVLKCIVRNQDKPRTVRLRNKWVEVDPRFWNSEADVKVNVGLGRGTEAQRMAFLQQIAMKQEQIITATGPSNPLVAPSQFRNTLAEMLRLGGYKDASKYFKPLTAEDDARIAQEAQQSKQKDPATILAEAELVKAQMTARSREEERRFDMIKAQADDDRERDKMTMDFVLKAAEIQAKYGAQVDIASMRAMVERERSAFQIQADQQAQQQAMQQQHEREQALGQQRIASGENVAVFRAQQAAQQAAQRAAMRPQPMGAPPAGGAA